MPENASTVCLGQPGGARAPAAAASKGGEAERGEAGVLRYVVHRLLIMVPTLLAISLITFVIIQLPPGDYLSSYIAELQAQGRADSGR